jgi:hypothetical protein
MNTLFNKVFFWLQMPQTGCVEVVGEVLDLHMPLMPERPQIPESATHPDNNSFLGLSKLSSISVITRFSGVLRVGW